MKDLCNYSLLAHNTFGIEACCDRFLEYNTIQEAQLVAQMVKGQEPLLLIGGGSNLLLTNDFHGIVVHSAIKGHEVVSETTDEVLLRVGSGEVWDDIVALCVDNGWYGAENLSLIPGEVGASAVQNIGAYGAEASHIIDKVETVRLIDGSCCQMMASECCYGYRQSRFKQDWKNRYLITHVTYRLSKTFSPCLDYGNIRAELEQRAISNPTAQQLRDVIIAIRQQKLPDPKIEGNAGSFFMNPVVSQEQFEIIQKDYPNMPYYVVPNGVKIPAGWLIEQCGWKGKSLGPAAVHSRQALVLVNLGGATGQDILHLSDTVRQAVKDKFNINIHPEVNII